MFKKIVKAVKKAAPVVGGVAGAYFGGPIGASIGAGLGTAAQGKGIGDVATNALLGYGLGSLAGGAMTARGASFGKLGFQAPVGKMSETAISQQLAKQAAAKEAGILSNVIQAAKDMPFAAKAGLGLGALGLATAAEEEKDSTMTPFPEVGSQGFLSRERGRVRYFDPIERTYTATTPQTLSYAKEGGSTDDFPRKTGKIEGPGTETSDDIPAMLSDGEFVMTAKAVRGLGSLNGASEDKLEQRRKGAKMMYDMMDKFEKQVA